MAMSPGHPLDQPTSDRNTLDAGLDMQIVESPQSVKEEKDLADLEVIHSIVSSGLRYSVSGIN